jgi:hypothetical protein
MFAWRWWQRRSQPATAFAGGPALREVAPNDSQPRTNFGGFGGSTRDRPPHPSATFRSRLNRKTSPPSNGSWAKSRQLTEPRTSARCGST